MNPDKSIETTLEYRFGDFRIDVGERTLTKKGQQVPLTIKAFDTLLVLVENSGRILLKGALIEAVWPDAAVEENNLNQQISTLRKALGGDDGSRIIETVPRRGYRFTCPVEVFRLDDPAQTNGSDALTLARADAAADKGPPVPDVAHDTENDALRQSRSVLMPTRVLIGIAAAGLIVIVAAASYMWRPPVHQAVRSIAVLPFRPLVAGGPSTDEFLELGMADTLITKLSRVRQLTVRPTTSVIIYAGRDHDPVEAGKSLKVDSVLAGRFTRLGDRIRFSVQLIKPDDGNVLWADTFDHSSGDLLSLQDSISERVVRALAINLTGAEQRVLAKSTTSDNEAYQLYLKGRLHWYKWTPDGWAKAREYLHQAIERDPNFALAYAGLADAYGVMAFVRPVRENYAPSKAAALKAVELDAELPEAHIAMSAVKMFSEWDVANAEKEIVTALELNPNSALARDFYAIILGASGRFDESLEQARLALSLDPLSPYMNTDLGMALFYARRFDEAEKAINDALEIEPNHVDALNYLAAIHEQRGEYAASVELWRRSYAILGDEEMARAISHGVQAGDPAHGFSACVEKLRARGKVSYVTPMDLAYLYARLGENKAAIEYLEKALDERSAWLVWIDVDPRWDRLRGDPDFQQLRRKIESVKGTPPT